jgi:hypothetical protein
VSIQRPFDDAEPVRHDAMETVEERRSAGFGLVATGTLACPACDAPVSPGAGLAPQDDLQCPVCLHHGVTRDFLSLSAPTRPAKVEIWITAPRAA